MKPIIVFATVLVVGGIAFYGGIQFQKNQSGIGKNGNAAFQQGFGRNGNGARRMGNGAVLGDVLSMDEGSITVKLMDGSSRIVLFSDKTVYNKTAPVSKSELKVGEKVSVFGTPNADGSVTAQNVQLNPQIRTGGTMNGSATGSAR